MTAPDLLLTLLAAAVVVPLAVLAGECLAALLPARRTPDGPRPGCAVLVPAHNEEAGLGRTLNALRDRLRPADRLIVIADNCTDQTAAVARAFTSVEVLERHDADRRGKGYALDFGIRHLDANPPAVVIVVDADCEVSPNLLDRLTALAAATGRPVQAVDELLPPAGAPATQRFSAFAFRFRNVIRARGRDRLGLPCLLCGTGMAVPWELLRGARLASADLAEDMSLGAALALAGRPPVFCPDAWVRGELPERSKAALTQRQRWEHGHLFTLRREVPRLLAAGLRRGRFDLIALALALGVPPLALLAVLELLVLAVLLIGWALGGPSGPAVTLAVGGAVALLAVGAAWARFGRDVLPPRALLALPLYVAWKVPIYLAFLVRPQKAWVRTERAADDLAPRPGAPIFAADDGFSPSPLAGEGRGGGWEPPVAGPSTPHPNPPPQGGRGQENPRPNT